MPRGRLLAQWEGKPANRQEQTARAGRCDQGDVYGAARRAPRTEVTDVTRVLRAVRLHSRPHIDLLRVAGALCRS